ncbi:hypothetical protein BaRGS_00007452 [Batillaria attramentaria]|uniref:Uncharacterized protein n=1 Tax=Batillaria attramentaria TaxID=370345 RepID=A0ABD0LQH2_9CAEN
MEVVTAGKRAFWREREETLAASHNKEQQGLPNIRLVYRTRRSTKPRLLAGTNIKLSHLTLGNAQLGYCLRLLSAEGCFRDWLPDDAWRCSSETFVGGRETKRCGHISLAILCLFVCSFEYWVTAR